MSTLAIKPVHGENDHNTHHHHFFLRVQLLDICDAKPVRDGYAVKPPRPKDGLLEQLARHPFRVSESRDVGFRFNNGGSNIDVKMKVWNLHTFTASGSTDPPNTLQETWQCTPEFICASSVGELHDGDGNLYLPLEEDTSRYVCVQGPTKKYAQRDLITNKDGIVEIPISFLDWLLGTTVHVKFRDHVVAKAEGQFSADVPPKNLVVKLTGNAKDNQWSLEYHGQTRKFEDEIAIKTHPLSLSHIQQSLWAVRRVKPYTEQDPNDPVATVPTNRPAGATINGIVVHYNSGVFGSEKRGNSYVLLGNVFDNNWFPYMQDNDYLGSVEQALRVLKALFPSRKVGYHYHIERSGTIISVVEEPQSAGHAGVSREPSTVSVEQNTEVSAKQGSYDRDTVAEDLNRTYIGIDVMGHHTPAKYQYTEHQVWYLDRLIENILARRPDVKWHNILGHDEIRTAYKQAHPASTAEWKEDPGAALPGGMVRLRGRHGWTPS